MSITQTIREQIARELRDAEVSRVPIAPVSARYEELTEADAYAIQRINRDLRRQSGEHIVGHKIGLTSLAMQEMLGVSTPDVGSITNEMVIDDGATLQLDELIAGRVEAEFAFVIAKPLHGVEITAHALRDSISHIGLAAEIIDSRIRDWNIGLIDTVADNASSARIVTGAMLEATPALFDVLPHTMIHLMENDVEIDAGPGSAVLGDPLNALTWLAESLGARHVPLGVGDVVLAGSVHRMQPLARGAQYSVRAQGFPEVTFSVE